MFNFNPLKSSLKKLGGGSGYSSHIFQMSQAATIS